MAVRSWAFLSAVFLPTIAFADSVREAPRSLNCIGEVVVSNTVLDASVLKGRGGRAEKTSKASFTVHFIDFPEGEGESGTVEVTAQIDGFAGCLGKCSPVIKGWVNLDEKVIHLTNNNPTRADLEAYRNGNYSAPNPYFFIKINASSMVAESHFNHSYSYTYKNTPGFRSISSEGQFYCDQ